MPVPWPCGESAVPHSGFTAAMSSSARVGLDQDMGAIDSGIEKAHGGDIRAGPLCSLGQILGHLPLLIAVQFVEKEDGTVTGPSKLHDRKAREQHQFNRCSVGEHGQHYVLGEVEPPFSLCRTRPEPLDQVLELVLESAQAPDLPPHLPAGRWESRHVIGPERFESCLANGLDGFNEIPCAEALPLGVSSPS